MEGRRTYASVIDPNLIKEMQEYAKHFPNMHLTLSTTKAMHSTGSDDLSYRKMMVDGYQNDMVFDDDEDGTKLKVIKMSLYCESGIRLMQKKSKILAGQIKHRSGRCTVD